MSAPRNQDVGLLCYLTSDSLNLGRRGRQWAAWLRVQGRPAACGHAALSDPDTWNLVIPVSGYPPMATVASKK